VLGVIVIVSPCFFTSSPLLLASSSRYIASFLETLSCFKLSILILLGVENPIPLDSAISEISSKESTSKLPRIVPVFEANALISSSLYFSTSFDGSGISERRDSVSSIRPLTSAWGAWTPWLSASMTVLKRRRRYAERGMPYLFANMAIMSTSSLSIITAFRLAGNSLYPTVEHSSGGENK